MSKTTRFIFISFVEEEVYSEISSLCAVSVPRIMTPPPPQVDRDVAQKKGKKGKGNKKGCSIFHSVLQKGFGKLLRLNHDAALRQSSRKLSPMKPFLLRLPPVHSAVAAIFFCFALLLLAESYSQKLISLISFSSGIFFGSEASFHFIFTILFY